MPTNEDIEISELEAFEPTRVDGVGKAANGFPVLMLKSLKPEVGETMEAFRERAAKEAGVAASGQPVPPPHDCPTCGGSGKLGVATDPDRACPDCDGTGRDGRYNTDNVREGFGGAMQEGDPREKEDGSSMKSEASEEEVAKRDFDPNVGGGVDRDKLDESDFAGKDRSFPVVTQADVSDALQSIGRAGPDNYDAATLKRNILRIARRKGFTVPESDRTDDEKGEKADATFSGPNPDLGRLATKVETTEPTQAPGSSEWEGVDAQTATDAALALMAAAELIRKFGEREAIEVAAGEGNDIFDTAAAEAALCGVSQSLGIMAQMAFHEGLAAQKSADDVEKAGRRLSMRSADALAAARDALTNLLGDDDPTKNETDDDTDEMSEKSLEIDMTVDELSKLLDERDAKLVSEFTKAMKRMKRKGSKRGKPAMDEAASVAHGEAEHASGGAAGHDAVEEDRELESQAAQGTNSSASGTRDAVGGAKAVLSAEEVDAAAQEKAAKKALRKAKKIKRAAREQAAMARALEESRAQAEEARKALEERLAIVEKAAAPSPVVRTRPTEALKTASQRDALVAQIERLEAFAKSTPDSDIRKGNLERAKELRTQLDAI